MTENRRPQGAVLNAETQKLFALPDQVVAKVRHSLEQPRLQRARREGSQRNQHGKHENIKGEVQEQPLFQAFLPANGSTGGGQTGWPAPGFQTD